MSLLDITFSDGIFDVAPWHGNSQIPVGYHEIIRRGNVRWIGMCLASQPNDAKQRAAELRTMTRVRMRHMLHIPPGSTKKTDDGMWKLPPLEWLNNIVIAHGYPNTGWYISDNNEFSTENETVLAEYIHTRIEIIQQSRGKGIKLALLSTPSHWPAFSENPKVKAWLDAGKFDELFKAIAEHQGEPSDPQITICPNAYYNELNDDGLRNVIALWERFKKATGKVPHMILGELAYAAPLDQFGRVNPHGGFKSIGMPPADMITGLIGRIQKFLLSRGIRGMLYNEGVIGGNEVTTFHCGHDTLLAALDAASKLAAPPIEPEPETPPAEPVLAVATDDSIRIRDKAVDGNITGLVDAGETVTVLEGADKIGVQDAWLKIRPSAGKEGYSAAWFFKRADAPKPEDPPKPEPEPPAAPNVDYDRIRRIIREENAALLQAVVDVFTHLQAMQNSSAQFVTLTLTELDDAIERFRKAS
jgi:hypothetical protein